MDKEYILLLLSMHLSCVCSPIFNKIGTRRMCCKDNWRY